MKTPRSISTVCANCSVDFLKAKKEYDRQIREGRSYFFCSRSCNTSHSNKMASPERVEASRKRLTQARLDGLIPPRTRDESSPYRYYIRKSKCRGVESNLTISYLKSLWEYQEGRCVYSHVDLILNEYVSTKRQDIRFLASLDRIDSTKGYIEGNVQFISACMNYGKSTLTDSQFRELLEILRSSNRK
jgi:YHS domain-containing protein